MAARQAQKQLLVEGKDDLHSVVRLMGSRIPWPKDDPPVRIKDCEGIDNILEPGFLSVTLKGSDLGILGVLIDADDAPRSRYGRGGDALARSHVAGAAKPPFAPATRWGPKTPVVWA